MGGSRRIMALLGIAFLVAILAAFLVSSFFSGDKQPTPVAAESPVTEVLVAGKAMLPGDRVQPGDLVWEKWYSKSIPPEFFTRDSAASMQGGAPSSDGSLASASQAEGVPDAEAGVGSAPSGESVEPSSAFVEEGGMSSEDVSEGASDTLAVENGTFDPDVETPIDAEVPFEIPEGFTGSYARTEILKGEPITARKLVIIGKEGGAMAALLKSGMRAVALSVEVQNASGGFILPNDHVDVLVTREVDSSGTAGSYVAQAVLTNVRVLAMDQTRNLRQDGDDAGVAEDVILAETATLELTPHGAEVLAVAGSMGSLSLVLRSAADSAEESWSGAARSGRLPAIYRSGVQK